jgi:putative membrane protein
MTPADDNHRMVDQLPVLAMVFALLAAAIHVYIFVLESVIFRRPFAWRAFGIRSQQDVEIVRSWAYNQGFYNLFLAVGVAVGVLLAISSDAGTAGAGVGMTLLATGSMLAAAIVLIAGDRGFLRAAAVQGLAPLLAIASVLVLS